MSETLRDLDYLEHIQQAITKILRYTAGRSEIDFRSDELLQDGVIRNLEVIGHNNARREWLLPQALQPMA